MFDPESFTGFISDPRPCDEEGHDFSGPLTDCLVAGWPIQYDEEGRAVTTKATGHICRRCSTLRVLGDN